MNVNRDSNKPRFDILPVSVSRRASTPALFHCPAVKWCVDPVILQRWIFYNAGFTEHYTAAASSVITAQE